MRVALISDIHGNDIAFQSVLDDIEHQNIDRIICLGDVATIGPQPVETLNRLMALDCPCILGNHDAALLSPDRAIDYLIAPTLHDSLRWSAGLIGEKHVQFLRSLPPVVKLPLGGDDTLFCFHGSPASNTDNILAVTPAKTLDEYLGKERAIVMAGGHTHIQMMRQHQGIMMINPGSIGHPFLQTPDPGQPPQLLPWAEYAIVDWSAGAISVDLRRVLFDIGLLRAAIRASDIPLKPWLIEQYR